MSAILEAAARAVATATGYHYSGDSIIENAEDNPRSAHFVAVARAVIDVVLPIEREACAKLADSYPEWTYWGMHANAAAANAAAAEIATAIRLGRPLTAAEIDAVKTTA